MFGSLLAEDPLRELVNSAQVDGRKQILDWMERVEPMETRQKVLQAVIVPALYWGSYADNNPVSRMADMLRSAMARR